MKPPFAKHETGGVQETIRRGEPVGTQAGSSAEEGVEEAEEPPGQKFRRPGRGHAEVRKQPAGVRQCGGGELSHHGREFFRAEAIEDEVGDDEIVAGRGRFPREYVGVDKLDPCGRTGPGAGELKHGSAGIDAGDFGPRMAAEQLGKESAVAFAEDEDPSGSFGFREEGRAAALEGVPGKAAFDPVVVRRDPVEAHAVGGKATF